MVSPVRIAGLILLIALLGWAVWEVQWTPQPVPLPDTTTDAAPASPAPPREFAPISDYRITLERPLFYPGRQSPNGAVASATDESDDAPPLTPTGGPRLTLSAVIEENGKRSALLAAPGQATSTRVQEGERIGDWRLVSIAEDSVTLESNGRREQLPLRNFGAAPFPPASSIPPPRRPRPQRPRRGAGMSSDRPPE